MRIGTTCLFEGHPGRGGEYALYGETGQDDDRILDKKEGMTSAYQSTIDIQKADKPGLRCGREDALQKESQDTPPVGSTHGQYVFSGRRNRSMPFLRTSGGGTRCIPFTSRPS